MDLADGGDKGDDLDTVGLLEVLLSNSSCSDATYDTNIQWLANDAHCDRSVFTNGFASTTPSATRASFDPVLFEVSPVRMGRPRVQIRLRIIVRPLVLIAHEQRNGRAEGAVVFKTGL